MSTAARVRTSLRPPGADMQQTGPCMLWCGRTAAALHWLGPLMLPQGTAALLVCAECAERLARAGEQQLAERDRDAAIPR
ncbi:hypothetical protein [Streptomyces aidingensis]|uniref:Uncharacterized protein n=1 Tax=Streptomyces aidingensis TaxID=910347 RepID=A0A1I1PXT2_9ACTN|nr:hypothetical protein [Streptomyces aidingensis]SFD12418.1 hypothetical protein SAMN05421773_1109 [Streptomyces aidingensis]